MVGFLFLCCHVLKVFGHPLGNNLENMDIKEKILSPHHAEKERIKIGV